MTVKDRISKQIKEIKSSVARVVAALDANERKRLTEKANAAISALTAARVEKNPFHVARAEYKAIPFVCDFEQAFSSANSKFIDKQIRGADEAARIAVEAPVMDWAMSALDELEAGDYVFVVPEREPNALWHQVASDVS